MQLFTRSILFMCLVFMALYGSAQHLDFVKTSGGLLKERAFDMETDGTYFYGVGSFEATCDFDPSSSTYNVTSYGGSDGYLAKYDAQGNVIFVLKMGGPANDAATHLSIDDNNDIYVVGTYSDTADFNPGTPNTQTVSSLPNERFIAKYDKWGNFMWVRSFENSIGLTIEDIEADNAGNLFLCGSFADTIDFQPFNYISNKKYAGSWRDGFLAKYSPAGVNLWVVNLIANSTNNISSISIEDSNKIFATGFHQGTTNFNSLGSSLLMGTPSINCFIASYDGNGQVLNAYELESNNIDRGGIIKVHGNHIYLTGVYSKGLDFDLSASTFYHDFDSTNYERDWFLAKYDNSMSLKWITSLRPYKHPSWSNDYVKATSLDVDLNGDIYLTGIFQEFFKADLNDTVVKVNALGMDDIFIAKVNSNGKTSWAKALRSGASEYSAYLKTQNSGEFILFGHYRSFTDFDPTSNINAPGPSSLSGNIFFAKYGDCINYDTVFHITFCNKSKYIFPDGKATDTSGIHKSHLISSNGCDSTVVTYADRIDINDRRLEVFGSKFYALNSNATYQWYDCNKKEILAGETAQTFYPIVNGNYAVIYFQNGCSDTSKCINISWLGFGNDNQNSNIEIFPNPIKDQLSITTSRELKEVTVDLIDVLGNVVYSEKLGRLLNHTVYLTNISPGLYYVNIVSSGLNYRKAVLVSP